MLDLEFSPEGERTINAADDWLASFSEDAAGRFSKRLAETITQLRTDLASGDAAKPRFDADASIYFSRKAYLHVMRTGKGRGRTAAGAWRVFYELVDRNTDGVADTLRVVGVYHGAARPLGERVTGSDDEGERER